MSETFGDELVVDPLGPWRRRLGPRAVGVELFPSFAVGATGSLLATRDRAGAVEQDAEQPRLERGAAFEAFYALDDREPGFLADLFGNGAAADGRFGQAQ